MEKYIYVGDRSSDHSAGARIGSAFRTMLVLLCTVLVVFSTVTPALAMSVAAPHSVDRVDSTPTSLATDSSVEDISAEETESTDRTTTQKPNATDERAVANVTLITGQTVQVVERDDRTTYRVDADVPMHRISGPDGTYIYPDGVDFQRFDPALFNVELLVAQNLTDGETDSIPVIASVQEDQQRYTTDTVSTLDSTSSLSVTHSLHSIDASAASISKANSAQAYEQLARNDDIESVSLDVKVRPALEDTGDIVNATGARQQYGVSGEGVTVAVLDTGIDNSHPDIDDAVVMEQDFTPEGTTDDTYGHGTHVAGIIAGDGTASSGTYVGMAPDTELMDLRVCMNDGCYSSDVINAMEYAVDNNADLISMSLGGTPYETRANDRYADAVAYAESHDVPIVASAGNDGPNYRTIGTPAFHEHVIAVGASDGNGGITSFSSRGPTPYGSFVKPDIVAPGYKVASARADGTSMGSPINDFYTRTSGTSMSAPVVSGVVALMLDNDSTLSSDRIKDTLVSSADPLEPQDVYTQGGGRVNASEAVSGDVVISPGVIDFGSIDGDANVSRIATVTNYGTEKRTFNVSVSAEDIESGGAGNVSVNQSMITLEPGQSTDLNLTVKPTAGTYSGRLSLDGEYTAIFGYERAIELTVNKNAISGGDVDNDYVWLLSNESNSEVYDGFAGLVFLGTDGTVTYKLPKTGSYHLFSDGVNEQTNEPIFISKSIDVTGDKTVTLDESNTVRYSFDKSAAEAKYGSLEERETKFVYMRNITSASYGMSWLGADNTTTRVSTDSRLNVSTSTAFVPASTTEDELFSAPVLFHVIQNTTGVSGSKVYDVDPAQLGRRNVTYHWPDQYPEHTVSSHAPVEMNGHEMWLNVVGTGMTPDEQTLYVSPGIEYGLSATDPELFGWYLDQWEETSLTSGESIEDEMGRHPYTGTFYEWQYESGTSSDTLSFSPVIQADQSGVTREYNDDYLDTVETCVNGVCEETSTLSWLNLTHTLDVVDGDDVTITTDGVNEQTPLSTRTKTTYRTTYVSGTDSVPPRISLVNVTGLSTNSVTHNGTVTVRFTVADESTIPKTSAFFAIGTPESTPFNGSNAWSGVDTTHIGGNTYEATYDVSGYFGPVSLALRAEDEHGSSTETTAFAGFAVADTRKPVVTVTAVGDNETSTAAPNEQTIYTNGTFFANATADGTPGNAKNVWYVLSADFTNYRGWEPASTTDGANWSETVNLSALPDDGNYSLGARAEDTNGNTNSTTTNVTIVLDRSSPELGATLKRLNSTLGRVTVTTDEQLRAPPNVTIDSPSGVVTPPVEKNGSVWEANFSVSQDGQYDVTVTGADHVGNLGEANASANFSTVSTENKTVTVKLEKSKIFVRFNTSQEVNDSFVTLTESRSELAPLSRNLAGLSFLNGEIGKTLSDNLTNATIGIPVEKLKLPKGADKNEVNISYYNESVGQWEVQETEIKNVTLEDGTSGEYLVTNVTHFSTYGAVVQDDDAPSVTKTSPGQTLTYGESAKVRFDYSDTISGVNVSSVDLTFEGQSVTNSAKTNITSQYATYQTASLEPGTYNATMNVSDKAGNNVTTMTTFEVQTDATPPQVVGTNIEDGAELPAGTTSKTIRVTFADSGSGLNVSSAHINIDGKIDITGSLLVTGGDTIEYGVGGLTDGSTHTYTAEIEDMEGNLQTKTITFTVASGGGGGGGGGAGPTSASVDVTPGPNGVAIDILGGSAGQTAWAELSTLETNGVTFDGYGIEFERGSSASVTVDAMATPPEGTSELAGALTYLRVDERYVMSSTIDKSRLRATVSKDALPDGASMNDVTVYHYHEGKWRPVWTFQDGQSITGIAPRIAPLAIGVESPAAISVADVTLSAEEVPPGEKVTVRATVENTGGSKGTFEVALTLDGETVEKKTVRVAPGKSKTVTFSRTFSEAGTYDVTVNDVSAGSIDVVQADQTTTSGSSSDDSGDGGDDGATENEGGQPGFGVFVSLVALAGFALVRRR
ncbi:S8 family serine peptidase [Haladaptatus sp. NG-SE-30]